jgi:hypothetical protein
VGFFKQTRQSRIGEAIANGVSPDRFAGGVDKLAASRPPAGREFPQSLRYLLAIPRLVDAVGRFTKQPVEMGFERRDRRLINLSEQDFSGLMPINVMQFTKPWATGS